VPLRPFGLALSLLAAAVPGLAAQTPDSGHTIAVGEKKSGELTAQDSVYPDHTHFQIWRLLGLGTDTIAVDLESPDFDPILAVKGPRVTHVDDDGGPGCAARLVFAPAARGNYIIIVNTTVLPARQVGRYTLSVTRAVEPDLTDDPCPGRAAGTPAQAAPRPDRILLMGRPFTSTLTKDDYLRGADSTYVQVWTVRGNKDETVTIDLTSDDFDAYLFLLGPGVSGGRRWQDDDSGGNCNARLTVTFPQTADYQVVVNTQKRFGTGAFTLEVSPGARPPSLERCRRDQ